MTDKPRYAIYFVPAANTPLYRFGCGLLGHDSYTGESCARSIPEGLTTSEWIELTEAPRKYGFHATLKAPFHLSPTYDESELTKGLDEFATAQKPIRSIASAVQTLGSFAAVAPQAKSAALLHLAAACVEQLDHFRAAMTAQERARRADSKLTERQLANLDRWGYPYVLDDFKFHMTLTGPIAADRRDPVVTVLRSMFADACCDVTVDRIALLRQLQRNSNFHVLRSAPLISVEAAVSTPAPDSSGRGQTGTVR